MIPQRADPRVDPVGRRRRAGLTDRCDRSGSFQRMSSVEFLKPGGEKSCINFQAAERQLVPGRRLLRFNAA